MPDAALLVVAAVFIGWVSSMVGVGGGIFMVPLLTLFFVPTTQVAVGTSLAAIVFNSLSSTVGYARQGAVDFRLGLVLMPTAALGAWIGAYASRSISSGGLAIAFGLFLVYVAGMMLAGKSPKDLGRRESRDATGSADPAPAANPSAPVTAALGFAAGIASGLFGIGGGAVMVPALTLGLGTDILTAVATSLFVMGPSALIGSAQHALQGNVHLDLAAPLALGIVIGAQLGALSTKRVSPRFLRRLFGVVLLYSAANMIWEGLG